MKKILYISPGFFHAREELFIELSKHFNIRFIEASSRMNGQPSDTYNKHVNYEIWKYNDFRLSKLKLKYIIPLFFSIIKELRKEDYDIVISSTQHPLYAKFVYILKPFFKYKLAYVNEVWEYHNVKHNIFSKLYEKLSLHILKKADFVLNEGIRSNNFAIQNGVPEKNCHIWPMASTDMKTKKLKSTPDLEKVFNTKEKHINYAYIGRLTEPKGAKDLFNAFELLDTEHQNKSNLYIIGRGPLSEELKKRAIQYSNVKILDWVNSSNLPYIYSQLDFFVLASHFDGFSTVSCEAASMSLPLILTDKVGAVPDLICNNNGFVVPTKNPQELANAITKMIDLTEQERKEMGKISRINFEKCASIQININTLYNICHD